MRVGSEVRVLQSVKQPGPRTNPYITQLLNSLADTEGVQVNSFSWRQALVGGYDVFHAHWPESLIEQRGAVSTTARRVAYGLVLLRLWCQGIPIVRTVHNLELPQGITWVDRRLLLATERLTRVRIVLNEFTPVPADCPSVLIEHGHYRSWFAEYPRPDPVAGRVVFFGKIRRYKNVEGLVSAFKGMSEAAPAPSLRVVGDPSTQRLVDSLRSIADGDARIEFRLGHVDDPDLVKEVGEASIVVLPYQEMHNSGSVLAALSMSRPVLVPDNKFNRALGDEVGGQWVIRYPGALTSEHLQDALHHTSARMVDGEPDLTRREWDTAGQRHLEAYRLAFGRRRENVSGECL